MFAQPLFVTPRGSSRSFFGEPSYARVPQASYYDDVPFGSFGRRPLFPQRRYAPPVYEYAESDESSTSSDEEDLNVCYCGKCNSQPAPAAIDRRSRVVPVASPVDRRRGTGIKPTPSRPMARRPVARAPDVSTAGDVSEPKAKRESPVVESPVARLAESEKAHESELSVETPEKLEAEDLEKKRAQVLASFSNVTAIVRETDTLRGQVEQFAGTKQSKDYLRLEDTLTRVLLRLDMVESHGDVKIRSVRRNAVVSAQEALDLLESKAKAAETPAVETQSSVTSMSGQEDGVSEDEENSDISEDGLTAKGESDDDNNNLDTSLLFGF